MSAVGFPPITVRALCLPLCAPKLPSARDCAHDVFCRLEWRHALCDAIKIATIRSASSYKIVFRTKLAHPVMADLRESRHSTMASFCSKPFQRWKVLFFFLPGRKWDPGCIAALLLDILISRVAGVGWGGWNRHNLWEWLGFVGPSGEKQRDSHMHL